MDVGLKEKKIDALQEKVSEMKQLCGGHDVPAKLQVRAGCISVVVTLHNKVSCHVLSSCHSSTHTTQHYAQHYAQKAVLTNSEKKKVFSLKFIK